MEWTEGTNGYIGWGANKNKRDSIPGGYVLQQPIDVNGVVKSKPVTPPAAPPKAPPKATAKVTPAGTDAPIRYFGTAAKVAAKTTTQEAKDVAAKAVGPQDLLTEMKAQDAKYSNYQKAIAGAGFLIDVVNANNAYHAAEGQAAMNIMQTKIQASDAISRGRQAQLDAQSEGYGQGQSAVASLAAQGQDVSGAGVHKVEGSFEAMGAFNGMRHEINSMREALGYDLEAVNTQHQLAGAGIARSNAIMGSALNTAVTMAVL